MRVPLNVVIDIPDSHDPETVTDEVFDCLNDHLDTSGSWTVHDVRLEDA